MGATIEQFAELGIKARYLKAVEHYWPNPISVEIPHQISYLNQGTGRQACRIPADEPFAALLREVGVLQTTSANHPDKPTAVTLQAAQDYFGDTVDFYVDGGDLSGRPASTIIRVIDDAVEIVREGSIKIDPQTGAII